MKPVTEENFEHTKSLASHGLRSRIRNTAFKRSCNPSFYSLIFNIPTTKTSTNLIVPAFLSASYLELCPVLAFDMIRPHFDNFALPFQLWYFCPFSHLMAVNSHSGYFVSTSLLSTPFQTVFN